MLVKRNQVAVGRKRLQRDNLSITVSNLHQDWLAIDPDSVEFGHRSVDLLDLVVSSSLKHFKHNATRWIASLVH